MTNNEKVKEYFQRSISKFDLLYAEEKSNFRDFIDKRLRSDNYERYDLTLQECSDIHGKRILDIGCGSGRYCIELAKRKPDIVKGIDFSENALDIARKLSETNQLSNICSFECVDFNECQFDSKFHITIAIGVMDYIADPVTMISRMIDITQEKMIMTFPSKSTYRMAIRKLRYRLRGCPLFFYDDKQIKSIFAESGVNNYRIQKLSGCDNCGDFFVVADLGNGDSDKS